MVIKIIQILLAVYLLLVLFMFFKNYRKSKEPMTTKERLQYYGIGFVCEFFDTLGIGCYAPLTTAYHLVGIPDELLPGTLNVGSCVAVLIEALIFITVVKVEPMTLLLVTLVSAIGAFAGARLTTKVSKKILQRVLGSALFIAAVLMVCNMMGWMPGGGDANGLSGIKLVVLLIAEFIFGALISFGLGNYAPTMVVVCLLGMSPLVAFPMMMCSAATGLSTAAIGFMKQGNYHKGACVGNIIGGAIGVLIAAYLVKSLPLTILKWLVVVVAIYTSFTLFKSSGKKKEQKIQAKGVTEGE